MAEASLCPDERDLRHLFAGAVDDPAIEALEQHLLECDVCCQTVKRLEEEDTWISACGKGTIVSGPEQETGQTEELIRRLEGLIASLSAEPSPSTVRAEWKDIPADQTGAKESQTLPSATEGYDFLAPAQEPGEIGRLGSYRILRVLGSGGMGIVFEAEDTHLVRRVAVKVIKQPFAANESARQRFLREARAAAAIEHDHIVSIFHVGEEGGVPFLVMPFLKGESLEGRLLRKREGEKTAMLSIPEVLRIGREMAEGLQAAHEGGLIHRDIKPGNIWLEGKRGRVKILDFGLARAAKGESQLTQQGAIVGTPAYMAPEQAEGKAVDHRCDLFSLGCVLYRMTTGQAPFKGSDTLSILRSVAIESPQPPRQINPAVPAGLSDLILRLLGKRPEDRPASAQEVAERLAALAHEEPAAPVVVPVVQPAAPPAPPRRRRWAMPAMLLVAPLLLVTGAVIYVQTDKGTLEIKTFDAKVKVSVEQDGAQVDILDPQSKQQLSIRSGRYTLKLIGAEGEGLELSTDQGDNPVTLKRGGKVIVTVRKKPPPLPPPPQGRTMAERIAAGAPPLKPPAPGVPLSWLAPVTRPAKLPGVQSWSIETRVPRGEVRAVAYSPDGRWLAEGGQDGAIRLWETRTWQVRALLGHHHVVVSLTWSPDSTALASSSSWDSTVYVWEVSSGRLLRKLLSPAGGILSLGWSPAHSILAATTHVGRLYTWDIGTGRLLKNIEAHKNGVGSLSWSPDGKRIATASSVVRVWDATSGKCLHTFDKWAGLVAWSPRGKALAYAAGDGLEIVEPETGKRLKTVKAQLIHGTLTWSPDGNILAAGSHGSVYLFDESGQLLGTPAAPVGVLYSTSWSPNGKTLACGGTGGFALLDTATLKVVKDRPSATLLNGFAWSPDGKMLAVGSGHIHHPPWGVHLWDAHSGRHLRLLIRLASQPVALAWSAEGKTLAAYPQGGSLVLRNVDGSSPSPGELKLPGPTAYSGLAWSPGKNLAVRYDDNSIQVWDPATGKVLRKLVGNTGPMSCLPGDATWSPDGKMFAARGFTGVVVWAAETGKPLATFKDVSGAPLAWSPDSRTLAWGGSLLDPHAQKVRKELIQGQGAYCGHARPIRAVVWLADGKTLVTSDFMTIRSWDTDKGVKMGQVSLGGRGCPGMA
jgi:WD40 repeat protein/tRNA A-37 threonylcarbamoyl transferase component Bud32